MAKTVKQAMDIQDQQVNITKNRTSVDGTQLKSLDTRLEEQLATQANGGIVYPKRDDIGNIMLYEDSVYLGSQLEQSDQHISIGLVKPDYDDGQVQEVLDLDIKELFTSADTSEIARLRKELEDARQALRDASAKIIITETPIISLPGVPVEGGKELIFSGDFPTIIHTLPDVESGLISSSDLKFIVDTVIYNDETYTLENMSSPNPVGIKWWVINHVTENIFASGVSDTLYEVIQDLNGFPFLEYSIDLDVVLVLENNPSNFAGWYVNDQSTGNVEKYFKFSDQPEVRFRFMKRKDTGIPFIDEQRNFYYILAAFINEHAAIPSGNITKVNVTTARMLDGFIGIKDKFGTKMDVIELDIAGGIVNKKTIEIPFTVVGQTNNRIEITTPSFAIDSRISPIVAEEQRFKFDGWYGPPNHVTGVSEKIGTDLSISVKLRGDCINLIAGYVFDSVLVGRDPVDDPPDNEPLEQPPLPDPPVDDPVEPDEPIEPMNSDWVKDPWR